MGQRVVNGIDALRWPFVGLLLTVAFLAHDVAMADDAHTFDAEASHHRQAHVHGSSIAVSLNHTGSHGSDGEAPCLSTSCFPPIDCNVGQSFALPHADEGGGLDSSEFLGVADPWPKNPHFPLAVGLGNEPTRPPGVRRALFQVFLI